VCRRWTVVSATASSRLRRRSCCLHRKRLLACPDPHRLPLLLDPRQCEPAPKNMLPAGISLNIIVLLALRDVLSSHHLQHLNPARPLWQSETAGTPAGWPPVPWCSPTAGIHLSIMGWCVWGDFKNQRGVDCSLLQKDMNSAKPKPVCFWLSEKPTPESHLQALVLGLVRSDISGHEKVAVPPNGALYFHERQEHAIFSTLHYL